MPSAMTGVRMPSAMTGVRFGAFGHQQPACDAHGDIDVERLDHIEVSAVGWMALGVSWNDQITSF